MALLCACWMWFQQSSVLSRIIFLPLFRLPLTYVHSHICKSVLLDSSPLLFCSLTPSFSWLPFVVSKPVWLNSIKSHRTLFAEYPNACVCASFMCLQLWVLFESARGSNVLLCLHMCVFGACKFRALLSSPFSCSCAPLNMSDVLERDITTGAEREASFLSLPSPLYITSYWHQSLFILSSSPRSLSQIPLSLHLYFPSSVSAFKISSLFLSLFSFLLYFSKFAAICCSVFLFQLGLAHCLTDCNTSIPVEDTVAKFKVRSCVNQSWQSAPTHGSACTSIHTLSHRRWASLCRCVCIFVWRPLCESPLSARCTLTLFTSSQNALEDPSFHISRESALINLHQQGGLVCLCLYACVRSRLWPKKLRAKMVTCWELWPQQPRSGQRGWACKNTHSHTWDMVPLKIVKPFFKN